MKIEITKQDRFLDYIKEQGPENTTVATREGLKAIGFWSDDEISNVLDKWLDREVQKLFRSLPKNDEDGNVIERIHVIRKNEDGEKQEIYVQRSFLSFEDTVYAIRYRLDRVKYFRDEAVRLYEDAMGRLPAKEGKKLRRTFQGLLEFDVEPAWNEVQSS